MILGLSIQTFTIIHTVIALIGVATGLVVFVNWLRGHGLDIWNTIFLVSTILTSVTGFFFPFTQILPSHVFGIMSLVVLAVALVALYHYRLAGAWGRVYVGTTLFALYLNCFVDGRAGLPENPVGEGAGADAIRGAFPHRAIPAAGAVHRRRRLRGDPLPSATGGAHKWRSLRSRAAFAGASRSRATVSRPGSIWCAIFPCCRPGRRRIRRCPEWSFSLDQGGKVLKEWSWDEFNALPQTELKTDIHCVTTWSKLDTQWRGVTIDDLLKAAGLAEPPGDFTMAHCDGDYTTNVPVDDLVGAREWLRRITTARRSSPSMAARRGFWFLTFTSGRAPNGCARSNS